MKYIDGVLFLSKMEQTVLSDVTMNAIEESMDFTSYIDELMKFKDDITEMKVNHLNRCDRTERDDVLISLIEAMIEILDRYIILGFQAAQEAAGSTSIH